MILSLIGAVDLRGFIGIDELPFKTSPVFSSLLSGEPTALNPEDRESQDFLAKIESALECDSRHMSIEKASIPFPIFPLFGDAIAFKLPVSGVLVNNLIETSCALIQSGDWGIYTYNEIELSEDKQVESELLKNSIRIYFDPDRCVSMLNHAEISIELWVSSPGLITLQIDVNSSDPDFVTYWYPCVSAIETATYHLESLKDQYEGNENQAEALARVPHAGSFNKSMCNFRKALCDYLKPETRLEYPARQIDELETGLYSVLRLSSTENYQLAIKSATAHNENTRLSRIESDPYTTFVGWTAACIVVELGDKLGDSIQDLDEKAIYNLRLCMFIYNLFFFYERYLDTILIDYVFRQGKTFSDKILSVHKRIGDSINYLGDLRRASQYGSDRRLFEKWIEISNLEYSRNKTSDLISLIVSRIEEKNRRKTELFAAWIAIVTLVLGLSSIAVWVTALQTYLDLAEKKWSLSVVTRSLESTPTGHWLVVLYAAAAVILAIFWFVWGRRGNRY